MNRAELKQALINAELPSSEAARLVDLLDCECPHFIDGTCERPELNFYQGLDNLEF